MKFKKIDISRQGNFILAILLIHYLFFGYLANFYKKDIGQAVLYLYRVIFNPFSIVSLFILVGIVAFMVFRENFFEYGIRNSLWLVPIIIGESFVWYWFINETFDWTIIYRYFLNPGSYLTIITLIGVVLDGAIIGAYVKVKYKQFLEKTKKISI